MQTMLNAQTTATRSPLNSRRFAEPADSRHGMGKHPEGCAPSAQLGDPSRVGVTVRRALPQVVPTYGY